MKYLKYFEQDSDYQNYILGEYDKPNVSYVVNGNVVYFNPDVKIVGSKISGKFIVEDTNTTYPICASYVSDGNLEAGLKLEDIKSFKVDGVETELFIENIKPFSVNGICCKIETIGLHNFEMEINDENIAPWQLFINASYTELDVSQLNTIKLSNMTQMFNMCGNYLSLIIGLNKWDTSNVTNMNGMFGGRSVLTSLDLSTWNTSNVTDMASMFNYCKSLTSVGDLSNWDISNVKTMQRMFYGCESLTELKMGGNPTSLTNVNYMFDGINTNGTFYYNSAYDYSKIIGALPSTWVAIPCTMVDGVLVPN